MPIDNHNNEECEHDFDYFYEQTYFDGTKVVISECKYCGEEYEEEIEE